MVSKQICKNSKRWIKAAYHCYDQQTRADLLSSLRDNKRNSIKNDPKYRSWHVVYYREMERYVKIVWRNPNITESMAIEITQTSCKSRRNNIKKTLEETKPKN